MNAPVQIVPPQPLGDLTDFVDIIRFERTYCAMGVKSRPLAIDQLQFLAERWHLTDLVGADAVQRLMAEGFGQ